jgi:ATP-dependent RNA helicase RhlE
MLDMGFIPDIERIFSLTPFTRQTLFFSATMAPEIERITNTFLSNPARIEVARQATASETIAQELVRLKPSRRDRAAKEKRELLRTLIAREGDKCTNAIVFCNRKTDVDIVAKSLKTHGLDAAPIHGDLDQSQRTRTLDAFRDGSLRFLVASDVAARGLDVPAVSHVFNYDVPSHSEDYIHRIGRTGRAGRDGKAIMICTPSDEKLLDAIEKLTGKQIPSADLPEVQATEEREERPERAERPKRERRRKSDAPAKAAEPAEAVKTVEPVQAAEAEAPRAPQPPANHDRPREPREDRSRGGRRDTGRGGHDKGVVGMGDHLPSFIAMSFEERKTA